MRTAVYKMAKTSQSIEIKRDSLAHVVMKIQHFLLKCSSHLLQMITYNIYVIVCRHLGPLFSFFLTKASCEDPFHNAIASLTIMESAAKSIKHSWRLGTTRKF